MGILGSTMTTRAVSRRRMNGQNPANWAVVAPFLVVLIVLVSGCASKTPSLAPSVVLEPFPAEGPAPYVLQVGDLIGIRFWDNPELDEELMIRPDGMISMPFIDEVKAADKTPSELDAELTRLYQQELARPTITVIVRDAVGQQIFVGGEVEERGLYDFRGRLSLFQAIQMSGDFLDSAYRAEVMVIRTRPDGTRIARSVDLNPVLSGANPNADLMLQAWDVVFVPRKKITTFDIWVLQYIVPIYKLLPIRVVGTVELFGTDPIF